MTRKPTFIIFALILVLLGAGTIYIWLTTPQKIQTHIKAAFAHSGFENITLPEPETRFGQMRYTDIALDEDGFSKLKTMTLSYSVLSAFLGGTLDAISINGLDLTGEIQEDGTITLAGWNGNLQSFKTQWPITARTIHFENSRVSLLSEDWGGISLSGEAQFQPTRKNTGFQARIEGTQRQLSASTQIEGQITPEGFWESRIELEQGKFEIDDIRVTRIAGLLTLAGQGLRTTQIIGELQAGGLNILGLSWQNAAITLEGTPDRPQMVLAAKSAGFEGLELGITIENLNFPTALNGNIHINNLGTAFDYLQSQTLLPIEREALKPLDGLSNIQASFEHRDNLVFNIKKEDQNLDIKGIITNINPGYKVEFVSDPTSLHGDQGQNTRSSILVKGSLTKQEKALAGETTVTLKESALHFGALPVTITETTLILDDMKTLSGPAVTAQTCRISGLKIENKCTLDAQMKKARTAFSNLDVTGPGFEIYAPAVGTGADKTLLSIKEIDLNPLLALLSEPKWQGTGLFSGTLALKQDGDTLKLDSLHLQNKGVGILKLLDDKLFALMDMEDLEKETMKLALENFHYDLLEIKAEGAFPDQIKISVFGKGKNPILMQGRQFSIDFEITPDLSPLITKLISKQAGL